MKFFKKFKGEKIALEYMRLIEEYQLQNKVIKATTDSGSNMKKSFEKDLPSIIEEHNENVGFKLQLEDEGELEGEIAYDQDNNETEEEITIEKDDETTEDMIRFINDFSNQKIASIDRLACFSHTLQLVINDSIKDDSIVSNFMAKMGRIASPSHQCPGLAQSISTNLNLTIPNPGGVRWDSHYRCIFAINKLNKDQLNKFLIDNDYPNLIILPNEKEKIEEFLYIM